MSFDHLVAIRASNDNGIVTINGVNIKAFKLKAYLLIIASQLHKVYLFRSP